MFTRKLLGGLAFAAAVANAHENNENCHSVRTANNVFDLTPLENRTDGKYEKSNWPNFNGIVYWNYCAPAFPDSDIYAVYIHNDNEELLAGTELVTATDKLNGFGDVIGVSFYSESSTVCSGDANKTLRIRTELTCDPAKTAEPTSANWSVVYSDCGYTVTGSHAAGCPYIPRPLESNATERVPTFRTGKI